MSAHPTKYPEIIDDYTRRVSHCGTKLRPVVSADADFIVALRTNQSLNHHVSTTSAIICTQKLWIDDYLGRYMRGEEAYFIIEHAGVPFGTIRIYNFDINARTFVYGSWLISPDAPSCCAYSSTILNHDLGFAVLGFSKVLFDVRRLNKSVCRFHVAMGASLISEDELNRYYEITAKAYPNVRAKVERFAQRFYERPFP